MKFFYKDSTTERVYVQQRDLAMLLPYLDKVPESVRKVHEGPIVLNLSEYVCFDQLEDLNFFKKQKWILDYDEVKNLSFDEIVLKREDLAQKMSELLEADSSRQTKMYISLLEHAYNSYTILMWTMDNKRKMKVPMIPNIQSTIHFENDIYCANETYNENNIIIMRKDGKTLSSEELHADFTNDVINYYQNTINTDKTYINATLSLDAKFIILTPLPIKKKGKSFYQKVLSLGKKS